VAKGQLAALGKAGKQIGNSYRLADGQILTPPHNFRGTCTDCHPQFLMQGIAPNNFCCGAGAESGLGAGVSTRSKSGVESGLGSTGCAVAGPDSISLGMTVPMSMVSSLGRNNMIRPGVSLSRVSLRDAR